MRTSVTPRYFRSLVIDAAAKLAGFRTNKIVQMTDVEEAVLAACDLTEAERETITDDKLRRQIGLAFRSLRLRYCGKRVALTQQHARGEWSLTEAGVEDARTRSGCKEGLIVLNMGLGRDSITMLILLVTSRLYIDGKLIRPEDVDAVIFSDTGAEWRHTYALIPRVKALCEQHGLRFLVLAKPSEEAYRPWYNQMRAELVEARSKDEKHRAETAWWTQGDFSDMTIEEKAAQGVYHLRPPILMDFFRKGTIAARQDKSCTGNHKVMVIRKVMADLAREKYGVKSNASWGWLVRKGERRPHINLVGIAADEIHRLGAGGDAGGCFEATYCEEKYPLVVLNIDKAGEAAILEPAGFNDVMKSGCWLCPFQPLGQYWALRETEPELWANLLAYEQRARARAPKLFILGKETIDVLVEKWRARNPNATIEGVQAKSYTKGCGRKAA